ncbi:hypothetical protein B0G80_5916 [Paraburkholderia sp. BL6669N2]|uniref:hypothetical protein n=1 Tax=Paraburkholderia sp. BL6669N2 TaxID=1938807 RepID=UPI000E3804F7|nr:hypothetical protein [Paraburkholderia sp. BL6669N2]REG49542.1 hypothetical protein B0G80_5916 [Paraburkholderia sp. BL6669N2]
MTADRNMEASSDRYQEHDTNNASQRGTTNQEHASKDSTSGATGPGVETQGRGKGRAAEDQKELRRQRNRRIVEHPIGTKQGLIFTNPVNELYKSVAYQLRMRESGLYIGASSGDGKTAAIQLICQKIEDDFGPRAIGVHDLLNNDIPAPVAFHAGFLESLAVCRG